MNYEAIFSGKIKPIGNAMLNAIAALKKKGSIAFCGECRQQVYPEDKCTCDNPPPVKVEA